MPQANADEDPIETPDAGDEVATADTLLTGDDAAPETPADDAVDTEALEAQQYHQAVLASLNRFVAPQGTQQPAAPETRQEPQTRNDTQKRAKLDKQKLEAALPFIAAEGAGAEYVKHLHETVEQLQAELEGLSQLRGLSGLQGLLAHQDQLAEVAVERQENWRAEVHAGMDELAKLGFGELVGKNRAEREARARRGDEAMQNIANVLLEGAGAARKLAKASGKNLSFKDAIVRAFQAVTADVQKPQAVRQLHASVKAAARTGGLPSGRPGPVRRSTGPMPRTQRLADMQRKIDALNSGE